MKKFLLFLVFALVILTVIGAITGIRQQAAADPATGLDKPLLPTDPAQERLKTACHGLYAATANRRISSLTVDETELIDTCKEAGLYK